MKKLYTILSLFIASVAFAQVPLLVEDFNYPVGDALTAHGWTAHSAASTNPQLVTSPGLVFTGYVGSDIGLAAGVVNTGQDVNKPFDEQTSGSVYASFLVNAAANTAAGGVFFHFRDEASGSAFRARTFITPTTGKMSIGFSFNASAPQVTSTTELDFGVTYLFVVKYTIVDGAENDIVSLYIFKAGDDFTTEPSLPTLGPLTATHTTPDDPTTPLGPDINPNEVALRQFAADQGITVDGFRVKTGWDLAKDDIGTGIKEIGNKEFVVYPNPVSNGLLYISNSKNSLRQVEIFDPIGKRICSIVTSSNTLDVSGLKAGYYFIKIMEDDKINTSKFIVR